MKNWYSFDISYIGKTNILVVNEVEAEFLSGIKISDHKTAENSAKLLMKTGAGTIIITLGSEGAMAFTQDKDHFIPAFKVEAVDTTSAGDVFCGSFAVALIEGKEMEEAVRFANAAAALCVTKMGAQPSAPTRVEINDFLGKQ